VIVDSTHAARATSSTTDLGSPSAKVGSTAVPPTTTLLPDPTAALLGADLGAEIAALAVKSGQLERSLETRAAEAQDSLQNDAEQAEVATMHDEASTMRAGAWASGLMQIGAGACSVAAAGTSAGSTAGGLLKGASEGLSGAATLAGGLSKAAATDTEALATGYKALADAAQRSGAAARDGQKSASDFVQSAIDFYREYRATKAQADAAALHGA